MLERGSYPITGGPAAGTFGALIVRDVPFEFHIQNGSSQPTAISCIVTGIGKLDELQLGMYKLQISGKASGHQSFLAEYDPWKRSGEFIIP